MALSNKLLALVGSWQGTNRLWLKPKEPVRESAGTAVFQPAAQGKFLLLQYTWSFESQPQEGALLIGQDERQIHAAWIDSWHMQDNMMQLTGTGLADGPVMVQGSYAAPPGPDWGWRIALEPVSANQFKLLMYNIPPEGEAILAVEAQFARMA